MIDLVELERECADRVEQIERELNRVSLRVLRDPGYALRATSLELHLAQAERQLARARRAITQAKLNGEDYA